MSNCYYGLLFSFAFSRGKAGIKGSLFKRFIGILKKKLKIIIIPLSGRSNPVQDGESMYNFIKLNK